MKKQIEFRNQEQIDSLRQQIVETTNSKLGELLQAGDGIDFLKKIKFEECGFDPLFNHSTNFIEQVNQTFTYLTCLAAVEILLTKHPSHSFIVNFGTESGYDVISEDESIICECFASTSPDSNRKLLLDTSKVNSNTLAAFRYVVYYAKNPKVKHVENIRSKYNNINIITLQKL
ncbi:hypothetical protein [Oscillibacter ruminantium]|uniref:hypothetical protein n=1 Tax=Oscillibacter ruminantium TaxID=1263547 RepID=UPI00058DF2BA|nr:hypothetical protein [Oscillibacter ruminantium]